MSAQQGKNSADGQGRSGDIQARQTDDGSFELVVDTPASSPAAGAASEAASEASQSEPPGADAPKRGSRRTLVIGAVAVVAIVAAVAVAMSGDDKPGDNRPGATGDDTQAHSAGDGFRPYQEGPGEPSARPRPASAQEPPAEERLEKPVLEEPEVAHEAPADEQADEERDIDQEAAWRADQGADPEVVDEEAPEDEADLQDEQAEADEHQDHPINPKLDTRRLRTIKPKLHLPTKTPTLNRIQPKQIEQLQQNAPDSPPNTDDFEFDPNAEGVEPQEGGQEDYEEQGDPQQQGGQYDDPNRGSNGY